ncbi:Phosphatidylinositol 3,5-bisphosphate-binding protein [Brettanomyces nanus]|uniref:Phosphatidylinositol 3,5-bisphosphate-binding protein n=1 Tax=Eeniella nana TaxID=13502 RepID=A0A875RPM9_EENNA|nr:Phosphatidylinositol 3,5-bisphosphate-binding protein [Brettanomyces nanus]QPG75260.1 Phosphatidylinositol 3,5-bisphosphate-binding protein [Brettanomyces nanus]
MNTHKPLGYEHNLSESKLLNAAFNQDQSCFAICHESGFRVYNTDPMELRMKRNFSSSRQNSGIGLITMLYRTNYVALVGGGKQPRYPVNKLCIWDDLKKRPSMFLEFMSPILNALMTRIRIIVVLRNQVLVHAFESRPRLLGSYETYDNDNGACDLSINERNSILAFPSRSVGQIQLVDISPGNQDRNLISIIKAHRAKIQSLCMSNLGNMVASASETGTLIRIHDTANCALMFEFRRGLDKAIVTSMKFSPDDSKLAVLSDKNTLHVYSLRERLGMEGIDSGKNQAHFLKGFPMMPKYFKSTWSFASKDVGRREDLVNDFGVIGWSDNESIIILWKMKGIWEKYVMVDTMGDQGRKWEIVREGWRRLYE